MDKKCLSCKQTLTQRSQKRFCSNRCQSKQNFKNYIREWKTGNVTGNRGIVTRNISGHLKRFLIEKYKEKCFICGWNKKHPTTKVVPLEIDHIDGNADNNKEENLRLICPYCHALTPHFKNLNKGKGRKWRMDKYIQQREIKK